MERVYVEPRTFRPARWVVVTFSIASAWWAWAATWTAQHGPREWSTLLGAAFFSALFGLAATHHGSSAITVDEEGISHRGLFGATRARWSQCEGFGVLPGPVTLYVLRASGRMVRFTNLYRQHRELARHLQMRLGP
jgi:hypothetical protein